MLRLRRPPPPGGRVVAINGSVPRWVSRLVGWEARGFHLLMVEDSAADLAELAAWANDGRLITLLDGGGARAFDAAGCAGAFERLKSRRARGKVVIRVVEPEAQTLGQRLAAE